MVNLCACGCGQKTSIPQWNDRRNGWVKGIPLRFVKGHTLRLSSFRFSQGFGAENSNWKGDNISEQTGRERAERWFKYLPPCQLCGNKKSERHHRDGNAKNNEAANIAIVCRRCHMKLDGRLAKLPAMSKENQPKAVIASVKARRNKPLATAFL